VNSAERLLLDGDFRTAARALVKSDRAEFGDLLPEGRPDPSAHKVVFAIITRSQRNTPLTLPFFSLVGLRAASRHLDGFGFPVAVAAIKET